MIRFAKDKKGNFAIITALLAVLLIGALGGVLDLSLQWIRQSTIQRAADAAALAGARALEAGTEADAQKAIQLAAQANLPVGFPAVTFQATIDQAAGTVDVAGKGNTKPNFLQLLQIKELPIGAGSQALIQRKSYVDFYFLLDISESMNIAASDEDRAKLEAATQRSGRDRCAFGCHVADNNQISNYAISRMAGVTLRIDVLRAAADSMIDKVLELNDKAGSLVSTRVATSGFSSTFQDWLPPIKHAKALQASVRTPAVEPKPHTSMKPAFDGFKRKLGVQGTGQTQLDARKVAIVVTDGVRDEDPEFHNRQGLGPLDPAYCSAIKDNGITLAVLEIKYINYATRYDVGNFFRDRVSWYFNSISPSLKACASKGYYYQAQDSGSAQGQLLKIVDDILTVRRRLSN